MSSAEGRALANLPASWTYTCACVTRPDVHVAGEEIPANLLPELIFALRAQVQREKDA